MCVYVCWRRERSQISALMRCELEGMIQLTRTAKGFVFVWAAACSLNTEKVQIQCKFKLELNTTQHLKMYIYLKTTLVSINWIIIQFALLWGWSVLVLKWESHLEYFGRKQEWHWTAYKAAMWLNIVFLNGTGNPLINVLLTVWFIFYIYTRD